jgi:cell division protein ZapE
MCRHKRLVRSWNRPFDKLAGGAAITAETIRVAGRDITIERVAGDVGFASFASLCDVPLGARDYLAIAGRFAGLVLSDVPQFTDANENVARRFMWLIDALYDRGRFLIASADAILAIFIKAINGNLNLPAPHHGLVKWQSVAGCKIADKDRS